MIGLISGTLLICFGLLMPTASANTVLPVESSLEVDPATVSWPSQKNFEYQLTLRSGPEGADFRVRLPRESWGVDDVQGTPFTASEASLNGPGELEVGPVLVADPSPFACYRGGFPSIEYSYRLTLDPDTTTVLRMASGITAASVTGMDLDVKAEILDDTGVSSTVTAPITINGPQGVRIIGRVNRSDEYSNTARRPGEAFRITGRTVPAIEHRAIRFRAEPRSWSGEGKPPEPRELTATFTGQDGRFRTRPLKLNREATWVLTSRLDKPGAFDNTASCNGALTIDDGRDPATFADLDGKAFVSTSIRGPGRKPRMIEVSFGESDAWWKEGAASKEIVPVVGLNAGCNSSSSPYSIRNGILKLRHPTVSTAMACSDDRTRWVSQRLRKGVKASVAGRTLVLRSKRGWRVGLLRLRKFGQDG